MLIQKRIPFLLILKVDGLAILFFTAVGTAIYWLHHYGELEIGIPLPLIATQGTAVAILLGFKNNAAYDRWWEARKIWGGIVNQSRYLASQLVAYTDADEHGEGQGHDQLLREIVDRHLAYINLLRQQLRELPTEEESKKWLNNTDLAQISNAKNKATQVLTIQTQRFRQMFGNEGFDRFRLFEFMATVREFFELQGKAERIKNTPFQRHYSYFTTAFVWIFVLSLPFGFVGQGDWKVIPLGVLISTIFTILDRAGTFIEPPFANKMHDVPLSAICRTIEIDMLQQIGVNEVPSASVAKDGILM